MCAPFCPPLPSGEKGGGTCPRAPLTTGMFRTRTFTCTGGLSPHLPLSVYAPGPACPNM